MDDLTSALQKRANGRKKRVLLQTTLPCGTSELRFEVDWARRGPVIHDHLDSGSIGMPSKQFLYTVFQLHGWRWPDVIHIKINNCKNAIIAANLSWARHEKSLTSSFKRGPFGVLPFSTPCQKHRQRTSTPTTGRMTSTELHTHCLHSSYATDDWSLPVHTEAS